MKKKIVFSTLLLFSLVMMSGVEPHRQGRELPDEVPVAEVDSCALLYSQLGLEGKVSPKAFRTAYHGYYKVTQRHKELLTLIDFTKPSNSERLYVIDMAEGTMLFESVVAHGRNSGSLYATDFSNRSNSHQSSLGFYLTGETYRGSNGYSLRLDGLEKGFNDNARARAIVIHGAKYANPSICRGGQRLGRSFGCPALPEQLNRPIIDAIKGGSVLFIYAEDPNYLSKSQLVGEGNSAHVS